MIEEREQKEKSFWPLAARIRQGNRIFPHEDFDEYLESQGSQECHQVSILEQAAGANGTFVYPQLSPNSFGEPSYPIGAFSGRSNPGRRQKQARQKLKWQERRSNMKAASQASELPQSKKLLK